MKRKLLIFLMILSLIAPSACAQEQALIKWVDFDVSCEAMQEAIRLSSQAYEREQPCSWLQLLALAAVYGGGHVTKKQVQRAQMAFSEGKSPQQILGKQYRYYSYYLQAYTAALGGLVGHYAVAKQTPDGEMNWTFAYGIKAFSPIAEGYWYSHYDDFGAGRSYGFARKHLGNDLLGSAGTPIVAVEGGVIEAMGWNQYGGWRIGIRSHDQKRYYYYAHLQKDRPFAPGLHEGDIVQAGDVIGFMGRTGYSTKENTNNIETVHLHFGLQLIFDESQKECNSEIWIDVYEIVKLLHAHRSSVYRDTHDGTWKRVYGYRDVDMEEMH